MSRFFTTEAPKGRRTAVLAVLALGCVLLMAGIASGGEPVVASEDQVKAAYLVNFLLFITPTQTVARETCTIAILGKDPFGDSFRSVEGLRISEGGRRLFILRVSHYDESVADTLRDCDLVFVTASERRKTKDILAKLKGVPTVTVSDNEGFIEAGGMLRLVLIGSRVRWEMNQASIKAAGLAASSQLYRNAVRVMDELTGQ
jgi:hypothetical protein